MKLLWYHRFEITQTTLDNFLVFRNKDFMSPPRKFLHRSVYFTNDFNIVMEPLSFRFSIKMFTIEQFLPQFLNLVKDSAFAIKTLIRIPVASILSLNLLKWES
jgi:hypothetical protein